MKLKLKPKTFNNTEIQLLPNLAILFILHIFHFLATLFEQSFNTAIPHTISLITFFCISHKTKREDPNKNRRIGILILYPVSSYISQSFLSFLPTQTSRLLYLAISLLLSALITFLAMSVKDFAYTPKGEDFMDKIERLERENAAIQQLADDRKFYGMMLSHESRNVLNCLSNSLAFLDLNLNSVTPDMKKARENLSGAKYCSQTLLNYFNNYLENCKATESKTGKKANLPELLERIKGIIRPAMEFKKLKAIVTMDYDMPSNLEIDETSLTQIILNLIYNSIKFTDQGIVNINLRWRKNWCCKPSVNQGDLLIDVSDTGCGMSSQEVDRLFKPFTQTNADPAKRRQGSGLGLWLTKSLVEKLDGKMNVSSVLGKGSKFTVEFKGLNELDSVASLEDVRSESNTSKTGSLDNLDRSGVVLVDILLENLVVKTYMKNLGVKITEDLKTFKDISSYLEKNIEQDLVLVLDDAYMGKIKDLYEANPKLLANKLLIHISDDKDGLNVGNSMKQFSGYQHLERPVKWDDFAKILANDGIESQTTRGSNSSVSPRLMFK